MARTANYPNIAGKSDPYCEVSMGVQEHRTRVIQNTLNPRWNASMQFTIKDPQQDVLCITVYDRDLFTPNGACASRPWLLGVLVFHVCVFVGLCFIEMNFSHLRAK